MRILLSDRWSRLLAIWLVVVAIAALVEFPRGHDNITFAGAHVRKSLPGSVLEVVMIVLAALAGALWWRLRAIGGVASRGVATVARIIDVDWRVSVDRRIHSPGGLPDRPDYAYVMVHYVFGGREYNAGCELQRQAARDLVPGAEIEVLVDPSSPGRFVLADLS